MENLNSLRDRALKIATEHGFNEATIAEDFALIHSEVSEALEDHRAGEPVAKIWYEEKVVVHDREGEEIFVDGKTVKGAIRFSTMRRDNGSVSKPCGIPSELADVIIRVLHFAGKHGIDIEKAVNEKMLFNSTRPFKHGKTM